MEEFKMSFRLWPVWDVSVSYSHLCCSITFSWEICSTVDQLFLCTRIYIHQVVENVCESEKSYPKTQLIMVKLKFLSLMFFHALLLLLSTFRCKLYCIDKCYYLLFCVLNFSPFLVWYSSCVFLFTRNVRSVIRNRVITLYLIEKLGTIYL